MKTVDTLYAAIALDNDGNELGIAVYKAPLIGPMPLVTQDWSILAALVDVYVRQNPVQLFRVRRFDGGAIVELSTERGQQT